MPERNSATETTESEGRPETTASASVTITGESVRIELSVVDRAIAEHLGALAPGQRPAEVHRILAVGVRGLATMGMTASVARMTDEVQRVLGEATVETEARVNAILDAGNRALSESLDPGVRSSISARMMEELRAANAELLGRLDPDNSAGDSGRLVARINGMLGPGGMLEAQLRQSLDLDADGSALAELRKSIDGQFRELRDLFVADQARRLEAERGAAKGFAFEDRVEASVREAAAGIGSCTVDVTALCAGTLGVESKVGDLVITLPSGRRVAIEAKNTAAIGLRGRGGILDELDRAMVNRDAEFAICVAAADAYPAEVGTFGVYGNRLLVVDDGSGVLIGAAIRWAAAALDARQRTDGVLDAAAVVQRLERVSDLATRLSNSKRALASIRANVDQVRNDLDAMRTELLDAVDDAIRELNRAAAGSAIDNVA